MPTEPGREPEAIPDPAALAQGHRLLRAAAALELPAWIVGLLTLTLVSFLNLIASGLDAAALSFALLGGVAWLWWRGDRTPEVAVAGARRSGLPAEVQGLLTHVEVLIEALERGDDRVFVRDVMDLGVALDGLGPEAQRYFDERGADRARLRHGVCSLDPASNDRVAADRRRALHLELHRFAAAARGRPCGDPYRSRVADERGLLAVVREVALARTRRRYLGVLGLVGFGWWLGSRVLAAGQGEWRRLLGAPCNPWGDNPDCRLIPDDLDASVERLRWAVSMIELPSLDGLDPFALLVVAVASLPLFLLAAAMASRDAGWQSWAAALPGADPLAELPRSSLTRARRRLRVLDGCRRALAWLAFGALAAALIVGYANTWYDQTPLLRVIVIELATLAVLVIARLVTVREHRWQRRRLVRRIGRAPRSAALLTELFELRGELDHAAPVRGELLEQIADTLARAEPLGRLAADERDRVVARLRAGAARCPALGRAPRAELSLDLRACERLFARS